MITFDDDDDDAVRCGNVLKVIANQFLPFSCSCSLPRLDLAVF